MIKVNFKKITKMATIKVTACFLFKKNGIKKVQRYSNPSNYTLQITANSFVSMPKDY
jgi:hypothetical protein